MPGLVLMRQQQSTAKGVIFLTIEDEHGRANVVAYAHIAKRDRVALRPRGWWWRKAASTARDRHAEIPIVHLIAARLIDRSELLDTLVKIDGQDDGAWAERALARADKVKRLEPGSRRVKMPPT